MFPFKQPPSRAQVAKQTVADAVSGAAHSFSVHAHELLEGALESAHDKLEIIGEKVENVVESSPLDKAKTAVSAAGAATIAGAAKGAGEAAEKLGALKAGAVAGAAVAGKSVADKVDEFSSARHANDDIPDVKRARKQAQKEIDNMNKEAANYERELEKQLARDHQAFVAQQERMEREYAQLQAQLEEARAEQADLSERQAKADRKNNIVRVPLAPDDEIVAVDEDGGDYRYDEDEKSGGGNAWLLIGGVLLAGAGVVYYLLSSTGGRRKRAQIQDRVGQVADGVREKVTQNSDATGEVEPVVEGDVEEIVEAATDFSDYSNEKIADDKVISGTIEAKLPPTSAQIPNKAVDALSDVSDKVADGIAGAGAFLADKLEAAGAGAKSAAHSAADKLDDAKDKATAKLNDVKKSNSAQTDEVPDAVVVEIINDEPATGESSEEILAEVEATVRNIEDSARKKK